MGEYVDTQQRRQMVDSMLNILTTFNHSSIANQICILVLDNLKTLFDIVDIVTLQKFVITEFRQRHATLLAIITER